MGFQKNFRELIETENLRLQQQFELILEEAKVDRERAARELENAKEYASAASEISKRLFTEVRKSIKSKLTPNNYAIQKHRFQKMVEFCEKKGYPIEQDVILQFEAELKSDYEEAVRSQLAKEEQARIKEKLREELRAERELEQELKRAEADRIAIEKAIAEALARTHDEHSAEVEVLRQKLSEAEARSQRAQSMAQLTKAGHVYVISNIGSFGEGVFKIGLTRRLQPMDRIIELGDASVPFPFDVHMMISSSDAPALEAALHRRFKRQRVNRVNLRKEFFRVSIESIAEVVKEFQGDVDYVASPEALEYNETLQMSDEDFEFVSSQVDIESLPEE
ncbi:GIY-YIG nuclease family protein [Stieleria varia]|nr:GIY-YIG nuclease family protein [Stieleria varia]